MGRILPGLSKAAPAPGVPKSAETRSTGPSTKVWLVSRPVRHGFLILMRRAGGYSAQERTKHLYKNLHSSYQLYIRPAEATSVAALSARAAEYEKVLRRQNGEQSSSKSLQPVAAATYQKDECYWKCKQRDHIRLDCRRLPKKFSSRYGKNSVFTRDCQPSTGKHITGRGASPEGTK